MFFEELTEYLADPFTFFSGLMCPTVSSSPEQIVAGMEAYLDEARSLVVDVFSGERLLRHELERERRLEASWCARASTDPRAQQALLRQRLHARAARNLEEQLVHAIHASEAARAALRRLEESFAEARSRLAERARLEQRAAALAALRADVPAELVDPDA